VPTTSYRLLAAVACLCLTACSSRPVDLGDDDGESSGGEGDTDFGEDGGEPGPMPGPDEEGGEEDGGGDDEGFVPYPDVAQDVCDIWGDDCPAGEKCTAYATSGSVWDANKCVPVMGDGQPGDACDVFESSVDGLDTCAKGSMCWDVQADTEVGYCVAFCAGSPNDPQCPGDTLCPLYGDGVLPLCIPTCDPVTPTADCPNPDNLCVSSPGGNGFMCILDASGGQGPFGTACQYVNSCNYGLFCANADAVPDCEGSQGCCTPYCDLDQPDCPPDLGLECVPWYEEDQAPPGYEHVGACVLPG
jgi:hypothetical protein